MAELQNGPYGAPERTRTAYVLAEVAQERDRQDAKWGGPTHDDTHSPADFCRFIREHEVRAEQALSGEPVREFDDFRRQMLRVAGLAVAALEQWDRHWKPALDRAENDRLVAQITGRMVELHGPDESKWPKLSDLDAR